MKTAEFVRTILASGITKYRLAKSLGLAPVSVNQYLRGTRMSRATANKVLEVYNISITDVFE